MRSLEQIHNTKMAEQFLPKEATAAVAAVAAALIAQEEEEKGIKMFFR